MKKIITLFDKYENIIQPGRKLGTGGEGDVFELNDNSVVKIYHHPLPTAKQNKLKAMSSANMPSLFEISTWPIGTVHLGKQGPVGGIIMPKLVGFKEIHKLYGPAHRKNEFPSADWAFLIQAARNAAAAIATLHQFGYVVGDINPGNLAVSATALTKLIDCDSFQIKFNGQYYPCEVGVAHFTPPELQGKSFDRVVRTPNHDNFGFALLCFHLLFMGRHPFAGKYKNGKEDMSIEKAIQEFRFAYSLKSVNKGMSAPPNTLPLNFVGPELAQMFESAFEQSSVLGGRPTVSHWVAALDNLRANLVICARYPYHKFYRVLSGCPWCAIEAESGTLFFLPTSSTKTRPPIELAHIWQEILGIKPLGSCHLPTFSFKFSPEPPPASLLLPTATSKDYEQEAQKRYTELITSEADWNDIRNRWFTEVDDSEFLAKYAELKSIYNRLLDLNTQQKRDEQQLEAKVKELQLRNYLEKQYLDSAKITGIGTTRKAVLASYGIETAADVDRTKIMSIPGFGESLSFYLIHWRKNLESKFVYNPHNFPISSELIRLHHEINLKYEPLELALLSGTEELKQIKEKIVLHRNSLLKEAERRASVQIQAQANWILLKSNLEQVRLREKSLLINRFSKRDLSSVSAERSLSNTPIFTAENKMALQNSANNVSVKPILNSPVIPVNSSFFSLNTNNQLPKTKKKRIVVKIVLIMLILILLIMSYLLIYNTYKI